MKKFYSIIMVAASLAVAACQPKELDDIVPDVKPDVKSVKITATIEDIDATKVEYAISDDAIKPAWEVDDELFGFDANGVKFTYVVTEVDKTTGEATIEPKPGTTSYTPEVGTAVYGIYYPGKGVDDISSDGALAIDLAGQSGTLGTASPAIMCATATVTKGTEGNEIRFKFLNQTAIIGLKKIQVGSGDDLQKNAYVKQIAIEGVVTHGKLSVDGGEIKLTTGTKASTVYAVPATSSWVTDENGQIDFGAENPVAFAVLPSTHVPTVYAYTATAAFKNDTPMSTKEMAAGHYYYMSKKLDASAGPVASLTVGGVTSKYYNVSDAFDAADCSNANCSVKLLANCATTRNPQIRGTNGSGDITIDLNGKTLTMSHQFGVYDSDITICDSSSEVLANQGKITSAVSTVAAYYFSGSTLTLAGGTLENTANSQYALHLIGTSNATISGGCVKSTNYRGIYQASGCDLTITGGKVEAHGNAIYCNAGRTGATNLDVKGNAIVNSDSTALYVSAGVVSVSGSAQISSADRYSLYIGSGSASISGNCSFENPGYVIYSTKYSGIDAPVVNISGGYFNNVKEGWTSTNAPIYAYNGTINISAGHFTANGVNPLTASASGTVNVTGGYYNKAINSARLGDTYCNIVSSEPGYDFQVAQASAIASVEASSYTFKYSSLEGVARQLSERKDNATVSPVVTMLADVTGLESTFTPVAKAGESVTLNLDGHVISAESLSPVVSTSTDLIISENGNGEIITGGATALAVTGGTTTINGASLVGATNAASVTGGTLTINGGHFYGGVSSDIDNNGGSVAISSGWFRNEPSSDYLEEGTAAQQGSETHYYRTYNYTIDVETAVVNVNEVGYPSLGAAVAAANALDGEAPTVTITLLDDISYDSQINLTNANSKPIVFDLNGHTLSTSTAQFITSTGTSLVTITDSGEPKGMITSDAENIISLTTANAKIKLDGCIIKSTAAASATNADAAISLNYGYASNLPQLTIVNGARVYTQNAVTTIYDKCGQVTLEQCEITSGTDGTGRYGIYAYTAAQVIINAEASIYSTSSSAVHGGSNNASTAIHINGGYLYGTPALTASGKVHSEKFTIDGGFFSTDVSTISGYKATINGSIIPCTDGSHTPQPTGAPLVYSYKFTTSVAEVNGQGYDTFTDALNAANAYNEGEVELKILKDLSVNTVLLNNTSKKVTLDLNNKSISAESGVKPFIDVLSVVEIKNGSITSQDTATVRVHEGALTINNCTIIKGGTETLGGYFYNNGVIINRRGTLEINNSTVYTGTKNISLILSRGASAANKNNTKITNCKVVSSAEGTSTNNSSAAVTQFTYGDTEIDGGYYYSNTTTGSRATINRASTSGETSSVTATITIKNGYFCNGANGGICLRGNQLANIQGYTIEGGYFSSDPSASYTSSGKTYSPTISGTRSEESWSQSITVNETNYTLSGGYKVASTAQEASVDASTSTPVVTLGEARNGGVSF